MPSGRHSGRIVPSVLDRLFDDAPFAAVDPPHDLRQDLVALKRAVGRDLEMLLNTRANALSDLSPFPELAKSTIAYGLPDFSSKSAVSETDRNQIRQSIEQAIRIFEPRLEQTRVSLRLDAATATQFSFHIEALLRVDPIAEPVSFDAVLEVATQRYRID